MKRWTRRILLAVLVVIVVAIVATQIVLWTDFPRQLVLKLVQQQLGLRVEAASLSTGWFGSTTLRDVKVSLPLADESFLAMPVMEVDHTALIPLAITQKFDLDGIKLVKPIIVVRRDANGRWNLQDVAELLGKAGGGTPAPGTKAKPPKLPRLRVVDAVVTVIERDGRKAVIEPLNVTGDPQDALAYKYDAGVPDRLKVIGEVAPGENWKHDVKVFVEPAAEWLKPWVANPPQPLVASARWAGAVENGGVSGRLTIEQAKYETFSARGTARITAGASNGDGATGGATATINPQGLVVTTSVAAVPELRLTSGALRLKGTTVRAEQVGIAALGGSAQLDGSGDLAARTADLKAQWIDLPAPGGGGGVKHSGTITAQLRTPFPGGPEVSGTLVTRGTAAKGRWDGQVALAGSGRAWTDMAWTATARRLAWDGKQPVELTNFTARVANRDKLITLRGVEWPGHTVSAEGRYDLAQNTWEFRLNGREEKPTAVDYALSAAGKSKYVQLHQLMLRAQELEVALDGSWDAKLPKPVQAHFKITHAPRPQTGTDEPPIRGRLYAEGKVDGTLDPRNLAVAGELRTRNLFVFGREYGDIKGVMSGAIIDDSAQFAMRDLKLLGGQVRIDAMWPYEGAEQLVSDSERGVMRAQVVAEGLKLKELGDLLRTPLDSGDFRGEWIVDVPISRLRADAIAMRGSFSATKVAVAVDKFQADEVVGQTSLKDGILLADPITLRRTERDVKGTATLTVQTLLADAKRPTVTLDAKTWPIALGPDATAAVSATAKLLVDATAKSATGPVTARAAIATTQRAIGDASIEAQLDGRIAQLKKVVIDAAGGHAEGSGAIDAADPNRSTLTLTCTGLAGDRLVDLIPQLKGLNGTFGGVLTIAPATSDRAVEPLRLTLAITPATRTPTTLPATFNALEIGPMRFSAFANLRENFSLQRIVLDELPSEVRDAELHERNLVAAGVPLKDRPLRWNEVRLADGRVRLWARRGQHPAADAVQTHIIADFTQLDVNQLVHAVQPDAQPMPARATGQLTLHGNAKDLNLILGHGRVSITESDLANVDALALLYNLTSGLGKSTTRPTGSGSLEVSLQASTLSLKNIRYFNRGVEARAASVDIANVWSMPHSPVYGYIVGSPRPLKDVKLPILADFDAVLDATVSGLTTVKIEGTVEKPQVKEAVFAEAGDALKRLIVGDVNTANRSKNAE